MKLAERIFKRNDYYITSPFGYRTDPITGKKGVYHDGVDYGTKGEKWPQYAIHKGKVLSCGLDSKYANAKFVWVEYADLGFKLLYYHLDSINVKKGQEVDDNTIIGFTGKTGLATGIHLHLGMKYLDSNAYVNAEDYDYKGNILILPTKRDESKHQVEITYERLFARDNANGDKLGMFVPLGIYDVLEEITINGTRWVMINYNVWCALLEDCFIDYPIDTDEPNYKELYEKTKVELDTFKEVVEDMENNILKQLERV